MIFLFSFSRQYRVLGEVLIYAPFVLLLAIFIFVYIIIGLSKIENLLVSISDIPYILKEKILDFIENSKKVYNILIFFGGFLFFFGVTFALYDLLADVVDLVFWIAFPMVIILNSYQNRNINKVKADIILLSLEILSEMKEKEIK